MIFSIIVSNIINEKIKVLSDSHWFQFMEEKENTNISNVFGHLGHLVFHNFYVIQYYHNTTKMTPCSKIFARIIAFK